MNFQLYWKNLYVWEKTDIRQGPEPPENKKVRQGPDPPENNKNSEVHNKFVYNFVWDILYVLQNFKLQYNLQL